VARIPFVRHRTANQLRQKDRAGRHPVEKVRWHAVWLLARTDAPRTPAQVAAVVGLSGVTVRAVLHRGNASGLDGRTDGRKGNGSEPKRTARRRAARYAALRKRPPDGGVWTGPKVGRSVEGRWGVAVGPVTGWRWLRDLGFTFPVPRPSHPKAADRPRHRAGTETGDAASGVGGRPTPARSSRCGPRARPDSASRRSPGGCGGPGGAGRRRAGGPGTSGGPCPGSPGRRPGTRSPSSGPG